MNAFWLLILAAAGFVVAYHTYGRFLARRVLKINPQHRCPSQTLGDEYDFVPTRRHILMGHHFTSIAGLGPIVGPAVAVIWGWTPAVLWILFGAVFFGAVHDFGSLALSLRRQGRSIGDIAAELLTPRRACCSWSSFSWNYGCSSPKAGPCWSAECSPEQPPPRYSGGAGRPGRTTRSRARQEQSAEGGRIPV